MFGTICLPVAATRSTGVDLISKLSESFFASGWRVALKDRTRLVRVEDEEYVFASARVDDVIEYHRIRNIDQVEERWIRRIIGL